MRILGIPVFELRRYEPWASLASSARKPARFDPARHKHTALPGSPGSAQVGRSPYSLGHADSSRFKAVQAMLLLEDHLITDPCPDCMNKHSMFTSALLNEAATLADGGKRDLTRADQIEEIRQDIMKSSAIQTGEAGDDSLDLQRRVRGVRKGIQNEMGLGRA